MNIAFNIVYCILWPIYNLLYLARYYGREHIPTGGCLVCANHSHYSDPFFAAFALQRKNSVHFMAKIEIMRVPFLGWILKKAGVFAVDRGHSDIGAIKTAMKYLKDGERVMMFPEGTRTSGEGAAAKTGAIMLAARTNVPILPIYIPRKKHIFGRMKVIIGEPYTVERIRGGSEAYAAYAEELMDKIRSLAEEKH